MGVFGSKSFSIAEGEESMLTVLLRGRDAVQKEYYKCNVKDEEIYSLSFEGITQSAPGYNGCQKEMKVF